MMQDPQHLEHARSALQRILSTWPLSQSESAQEELIFTIVALVNQDAAWLVKTLTKAKNTECRDELRRFLPAKLAAEVRAALGEER